MAYFNVIAVRVDLIGAIQMKYSDHGQWEAGMRINLKDRYFPAFEVGYGKADESEDYVEESWCKTKAPYFRIGCDMNILRDKHDIYKLFVGIRYGYTKYSYAMTVGEPVSIDDDPDTEEDESSTTTSYYEHDNLKATYHWFEGVVGIDAKVFGPLHLGWDVRYRHALANKHDSAGTPWYIPGFGDKKNAGFTATFNITISL